MKKLMLFCLAACLCACGGDPKEIKDISTYITEVSDSMSAGKKVMVIKIKASSQTTASRLIYSPANEMREIFPKMLKHFPDLDAEYIDFIILGDLVDKYGNSRLAPIIRLSFKMSDIKKINFTQDFTPWRLLALVDEGYHLHPRVSHEAITEYCNETDNKRYAAVFCNTAKSFK